ncbi:hypothetical protein AX279_17725 [Pseudomonas sp. J237]|nr:MULTISPECIES: hypothetical protein [Pseudomonas]OEO24508.1 hypothetical protein AX279_17725 [Pseudomonas sp. J237]CRN69042.1 hypothetical protein PAERUG_P40_Scotland_4_VIM_2_09_12_04173 [Pseudomonas aeruginosa]
MLGCCGAERAKFKSRSGEIDQLRLEQLVAEKKKAGWPEQRLDKLKKCFCTCHTDGMNTYC